MSGDSHVCYLCKQGRPISEFTQRIDDRYYKMCKSCVSEILSKRKSGERLNHTDTHRTCALCRRFRANNQFTRRSKGSYYSACKECNKTSMPSVEERERWVLKDLSQQKNGKKRKHNMIHVLDAVNSGKILNALPT